MGTCPDTVKRLIDRFEQQSDQIRSPDYNETLIRIDYINPLMRELGWDMDNSAGYAERYREVAHEDRVKVAGQTKAPDYSFRVGGARKFTGGDATRMKRLTSLVDTMLSLHKRLAAEKNPQRREQVQREIDATDRADRRARLPALRVDRRRIPHRRGSTGSPQEDATR